jgi:hypothetical protein
MRMCKVPMPIYLEMELNKFIVVLSIANVFGAVIIITIFLYYFST